MDEKAATFDRTAIIIISERLDVSSVQSRRLS